jgi:hypothetical protein
MILKGKTLKTYFSKGIYTYKGATVQRHNGATVQRLNGKMMRGLENCRSPVTVPITIGSRFTDNYRLCVSF